MSIYQVCIPKSKHNFFDYLEGESRPEIGARVLVPFRNGQKIGIVVGKRDKEKTPYELKAITEVLDHKPIFANMLSLFFWVSEYYQSPLADVLAIALPKRYREGKALKKTLLQSSDHGLIKAPKTLNDEQEKAFTQICQYLGKYQSFLLNGVTGSGKTEIYLQIIDKVIKNNQQALVLVPEIGLTPQLLSRFTERFTVPIVTLHSKLNDNERQLGFESAAISQAKIVIGTRTSIFTPMPNLGIIIIDEEHDQSFKQLDNVRYSARDFAQMRALKANIPIVLGSATPSLETINNCINKKYIECRLVKRAEATTKLKYHIVNLQNQYIEHGLSSQALNAIKEHLEDKNQVLVFINRRGYAPVLLCHSCGATFDCKNCDSHLTYHKNINKLICHHCTMTTSVTNTCLICKSHDLITVGAGTQRIEDFLKNYFKEANILRVDRDEVSRKKAFAEKLDKINKGEANLIVGTQMLAKGHHFPSLTLVVIVDADNGFYSTDFRALEKLGQLITQVAGRAGRAEKAGEVIIQTHMPQNPALNTLIQKGYNQFALDILKTRKAAALPPFTHLAVIKAECKTQASLLKFLEKLKTKLQQYQVCVTGPVPAPLSRKENYYRMQLLLKSNNRKNLQTSLTASRKYLADKKLTRGIRYAIDVDPQDLS